MTDNSKMPYGKYKGWLMSNVPAEYLIWIFENNKTTPDVAKYISDNYNDLVKEIDSKQK